MIPGNDEREIIPEVWLQVLLTMTGDKQRKAEMIRKVAEKPVNLLNK